MRNLLDRWKQSEPVRLYLYTVAAAILVGGVTLGMLTDKAGTVLTAILSAVLLGPATEAARSKAYSPATVEALVRRGRPIPEDGAPFDLDAGFAKLAALGAVLILIGGVLLVLGLRDPAITGRDFTGLITALLGIFLVAVSAMHNHRF